MQFTNTNDSGVGKSSPTKDKGRVMPVGETVSLASIGKWLVGLVLAPWLWHERKRLDKLVAKLSENHYTKAEVKEQIKDRTEALNHDMHEVKETMKIMNKNVVAISVTVARIDERSKRKDE